MSATTTIARSAAAPRRRVLALTAACTALLMGLSSVSATAQPQPQPRDHRHAPAPQAHRHAPPPKAMRGPGPGQMRGAGPDQHWYKGDRLPPAYRSRQYVVNDWRAHRLSPPPRGYQWVQYGPDYMLVAITTGVILQLMLAN